MLFSIKIIYYIIYINTLIQTQTCVLFLINLSAPYRLLENVELRDLR